MNRNEEVKLDFFMSRIKHIEDIKETPKTKLSVVLYEGTGTTCILRVCKDRDLSAVYNALLNVKNPNVAMVYSYVYAGGNTYIIEEMLSGKTLETIIERDGTFSEKETAKIILEVINGLNDLHAMDPPVIHNDINTSNIMICDDSRVKLFDFDISRTYKEERNQNTELFGTEECASPEHYGYGQSEPRTDIYCLGVAMHRMLTGKYLSTDRKCLYKGRMKGIIEKCIKIDPKDRYISLQSLKKDLEGILTSKKTYIKLLALVCVLAVAFTGVCFVLGKIQNQNNNSDAQNESTTQAQITTESTEHTANITTTSNVEQKPEKEIVSERLEGELLSLIPQNDGTLVYLEKTSDGYRIRSSGGIEKILTSDFQAENCRLIYNPLVGNLYMVSTYKEEAAVYSISNSLEIGETPVYTAPQSYTSDIKGMFFSDGIMYCNAFDKDLIDTNTWKEYGYAKCTPVAVVCDRIYDLNSNCYMLDELSVNGDSLNQYEIPGETMFSRCCFADGNNLYLTVNQNKKDYVYAFDGEAFSEVLCLNDYRYYTGFKSALMVVSENYIWLYDNDTNTIKQFPIQ